MAMPMSMKSCESCWGRQLGYLFGDYAAFAVVDFAVGEFQGVDLVGTELLRLVAHYRGNVKLLLLMGVSVLAKGTGVKITLFLQQPIYSK
jgi:hypothetical protein